MNGIAMKTSKTHPLRVDWIEEAPANGRIGMTFCPGKVQDFAMTGCWQRDLAVDMQRLADLGTTHLLCLLEPWELDALQVPNLPAISRTYGIEYLSLPIKDAHAPEITWETTWSEVRPMLLERCRSGKVVIFCKGGLGRTGLYAAILLQELGLSALASVELVRKVRPGTIETARQLEYVLNYGLNKQTLGGQ
ncbi:MAG: hypothetical protein RLZZ298_3159 [Pseudomonadota bacterium]|jgi:ADP-ribosyl-[dinitrogen reductase] hydrolase